MIQKILTAAALCWLFFAQTTTAQTVIEPKNITIVRDKWGVPHIFTKTDAEAAYGLAWAHAEDDFKTIQEMLLVTRGRYGEVAGVNGAALDFLLGFCGTKDLVTTKYNVDISSEFKALCEGYCQALNKYAQLHPEEVLVKDLFPAQPQDIVTGYAFTSALFTGLPFVVKFILDNKPEEHEEGFYMQGSNAIALNSKKTQDGKVYLDVNSHQPLEGLFSWYEAHIKTEEGWNMLGGVFPGGNLIFHGSKPDHGWAATFNWPDLVDIYELELNPENKRQYKYDGKWLNLTEKTIPLRVKVGPLKINVKKKFFITEYGPALENKKGVYAVRVGALNEIRLGDQVYRMNKAKNLTEFKDALKMRALGSINFVYADRQDNIYYLSNGLIPKREPGYNWSKVVQGNTSKTRWTEYVPFEQLPQLENPSCGFLFNTNNTPFTCTCTQDNPNPALYDTLMGVQVYDNNRSRRLMEIMDNDQKFSYDDFVKAKYDLTYPKSGAFMESLKPLFELNPDEFPDIADAIKKIQSWNRNSHKDNTEAPLVLLAFLDLFKKRNGGSMTLEVGFASLKKEEIVESIRTAKKHLLKYFKTINVKLGDLQRHIRGKINLPMSGVPDVLAAMLSDMKKDGRLKTAAGESYIQLVVYGPNGLESIRTVNAYGASNRPESPHYTDQMEMFVNQQTKEMTFDEQKIRAEAEKIYSPE